MPPRLSLISHPWSRCLQRNGSSMTVHTPKLSLRPKRLSFSPLAPSSLSLARNISTSFSLRSSSLPVSPASSSESAPSPQEPRLSLTFTCTAPITSTSASSQVVAENTAAPGSAALLTQNCGHRSTHTFTKRAYEKGIVIIACPSCQNRHLIADNLGWFKNQDGSEGGKTVEDFVRANGEEVRRGNLVETPEGDVEYVP